MSLQIKRRITCCAIANLNLAWLWRYLLCKAGMAGIRVQVLRQTCLNVTQSAQALLEVLFQKKCLFVGVARKALERALKCMNAPHTYNMTLPGFT